MEENTIGLREIWTILVENLRKICLITAAFVIAAGVYLLIAAPVYESEALLRIKEPTGLGNSLLDAIPGSNAAGTKQRMSTYSEILKSRSVIEPVILATEEPEDGKYISYDSYIKGRVVTTPFKDTEILKVSVSAKTPEAAQQANMLIVEGFLNRLTDLSRSEKKETKEFIADRVDSAKKELDEAESALRDYKEKNKITEPTVDAKMVADRVGITDKAKAENQVNLATAQASLASINQQLGGAPSAIVDSASIKQYKQKLIELEMTKVSYLGKYTEEHSKMQEVNEAIASTKTKLQAEISNVAALQAPSDNPVQQGLLAGRFQSEAQVAVANGKTKAIASLEAENNGVIKKLPRLEQGFLRVSRDVNVAQEIYIMLAKRLEEAKVAEVMVSNDVQVIDGATLPENPVKPRKTLTLAISLLLGLLVGCGYVIAYELLNRKIRSVEDVEKYLELPLLGSVPNFDSLDKAQTSQKKSFWAKLRRTKK